MIRTEDQMLLKIARCIESAHENLFLRGVEEALDDIEEDLNSAVRTIRDLHKAIQQRKLK